MNRTPDLFIAVVVRSDKDDPREIERQQEADKAAAVDAATAQALTVGDIWPRYLAGADKLANKTIATYLKGLLIPVPDARNWPLSSGLMWISNGTA